MSAVPPIIISFGVRFVRTLALKAITRCAVASTRYSFVRYSLHAIKAGVLGIGGIMAVIHFDTNPGPLDKDSIHGIPVKAMDAVSEWNNPKLDKITKVQDYVLGVFVGSCPAIAINLALNLVAKRFTRLSFLKTGPYGMAAQGAVVTGFLFSVGFFDD